MWFRRPLDRQQHADCRSLACPRFDFSAAVMSFDNAADDRQAQTSSLGFGRGQDGCERAPPLFLVHAGACISEIYRNIRGAIAAAGEEDGA